MYYIDGKMLAQRIDDLCESRHISKEEFCKATGISTATLSHWRTGKYKPSDKNIKILEAFFEMPIENLLDVITDDISNETVQTYDSTAELRSMLRDHPEMRILFDAARGATPADIMEAAAQMMRRKEEREGK